MKAKELNEAREQFAELRRNLAATDRRPCALLVEDDRNDAELVKKKLHPFHVSLEVACSSFEAIEQLKVRQFDVIFLDLKLDVGSGLDVLRYAAQQSVKSIFIVLTGMDDHNPLIREALAEGAQFVIQKPITEDHLKVIFQTIP